MVATALTLVVSACGGSTSTSDPAATAPTTAAPAATSTSAPETFSPEGAALDGVDAAADLVDFTCVVSPRASDRWNATGTLTNSGDKRATYRVTVLVVDQGGRPGAVFRRTKRVPAGAATPVVLRRVRGPADGTCQVQVLRLPGAG